MKRDPDIDYVATGLMQALHRFIGADERWAKVRAEGADDTHLLEQIAEAFGLGGGHYGADMGWWAKGGKQPYFELQEPFKAKLTQNKLVKLARKLLEIPGGGAGRVALGHGGWPGVPQSVLDEFDRELELGGEGA